MSKKLESELSAPAHEIKALDFIGLCYPGGTEVKGESLKLPASVKTPMSELTNTRQVKGSNMKERCPNMNHSRSNAPVKYCPNCGEIVNRQAQRKCDGEKHAHLRKSGNTFCVDCGKKLSEMR